jgi:hypothetical protein
MRPAFGLLRSEYLGFVAGLAGIAGMNAAIFFLYPGKGLRDPFGLVLLTVMSYGALGYCYFHFVNLGETARRIRLLREIYEAGGSLSHQQLVTRYCAREIVEKRIQRLLGTGQIVCRDGRYYIGSPVMVLIAKTMVGLKILLLGQRSEYDN